MENSANSVMAALIQSEHDIIVDSNSMFTQADKSCLIMFIISMLISVISISILIPIISKIQQNKATVIRVLKELKLGEIESLKSRAERFYTWIYNDGYLKN